MSRHFLPTFLQVINSTPESTLNLFWAQSQSRSSSASAVATVQAVAAPSAGHPQEALLHIVGLLVRAPRNDVFLEQVCRHDFFCVYIFLSSTVYA
jgi:hypothetical protein